MVIRASLSILMFIFVSIAMFSWNLQEAASQSTYQPETYTRTMPDSWSNEKDAWGGSPTGAKKNSQSNQTKPNVAKPEPISDWSSGWGGNNTVSAPKLPNMQKAPEDSNYKNVLPNVSSEYRTALVIGNSNYDFGKLRNPVNDAKDITAALKNVGFNVTLINDVGLRDMKEAISDFGRRLKNNGGVGLFFYAGHGIQVGGINYLIPLGSQIDNDKIVEHEAFDVNRLFAYLDDAGNSTNIVILDACRDNPFGRSFRSYNRGLAIVSKQPPGTIISFSTGANQVAADGDGRNSPYTAALLRHIKTPGISLEQVFKRVRNQLFEETKGKQEPAEYTTLRADFYFNTNAVY